jgi:hypothetical protein
MDQSDTRSLPKKTPPRNSRFTYREFVALPGLIALRGNSGMITESHAK